MVDYAVIVEQRVIICPKKCASLPEATAVNQPSACDSEKDHKQPVFSTEIIASTDTVTPAVHHTDYMLLISGERALQVQTA